MTRVPEAIFIVDVNTEHTAVKEAKRLGITTLALVDSNCDPDHIDFVIAGNDDAAKAVQRIKELEHLGYEFEGAEASFELLLRKIQGDETDFFTLDRLRVRSELDNNGADWRAEDQLQFRTRGVLGWHRWQRIGDRVSTASAREFDSDYYGAPAYYNVSGSPGDTALRIAAIATKAQASVATADLLGMTATDQPLAVAAVARVEFRRPRGSAFASLGERRHEYANLFNPFWEAKLAPVTWSF